MIRLTRIAAISVLFVIVAFAFAAQKVASAEGVDTTTTVHNFSDASVVKDGTALLTRLKSGVSMEFTTVGLTPQDAVTVWWVVFNAPGQCSDGECGENDIFILDADGEFILNDDGSPPINGAGLEAAQISALRADGHVIDNAGTATFRSRLPVGDVSEAIFGGGLQKPMAAEVHLIVRTHGPAAAGNIDNMLYNVNGGCEGVFPNPPCSDVQFAVFKPVSE